LGTSTSFRSPPTTAWKAAQVALRETGQIAPTRAVSEIWNAAGGRELQSDAIRTFLRQWLSGLSSLRDSASPESPTHALKRFVADARHEAIQKDPNPLASQAERALFRLCRQVLAKNDSISTVSWSLAQERIDSELSRPSADRARAFLAELVAEATKFYASRDLPGILFEAKGNLVAASKRTEEMGDVARDILTTWSTPRLHEIDSQLGRAWNASVADAVRRLAQVGSG
jgi:hypothetical protein